MPIDRRTFLKSAGAVALTLGAGATLTQASPLKTRQPMEQVKMGLIGLGERGTEHLEMLLQLEGVVIKSVCDPDQKAAQNAVRICAEEDHPEPSVYTQGELDYERMLDQEDLDCVLISTPWRWHTPQAVAAMNAGNHAFVEVPAALTIEECWQLVNTAEKTDRQCMMLENVCYGQTELMALNMCRLGLFGEVTHGEGAYIHDLRTQMKQVERGTGSWRTVHHTKRNGNLYPTHAIGPIAQCMGVNRGDSLDFLVSLGSPALGRAKFAKENFAADHARNRSKYVCADINSTLIQTKNGRSLLLQHDTTTPRPYTRRLLLQGTEGIIQGFPDRVALDTDHGAHEWQNFDRHQSKYEHPLWKRLGEEATDNGGHGGMDFVMLWRLISCLRTGEPLDQDVYDAATWSAIAPLSEASVRQRSSSVEVPDFTRGAWKTRTQLGIVAQS